MIQSKDHMACLKETEGEQMFHTFLFSKIITTDQLYTPDKDISLPFTKLLNYLYLLICSEN